MGISSTMMTQLAIVSCVVSVALAYHPAVISHHPLVRADQTVHAKLSGGTGLQWEHQTGMTTSHLKTGVYGVAFSAKRRPPGSARRLLMQSKEESCNSTTGIFVAGSFVGELSLGEDGTSSHLLSAGGNDIFLARGIPQGENTTFDTLHTLDTDWIVRAGGQGNDAAAGIAIHKQSGSVYIAGSFEGTASFPHASTDAALESKSAISLRSSGAADIFLASYAQDGTAQWALRAGGDGDDSTSSVATSDYEDTVFVGGWFSGRVQFDTISGIASDHSGFGVLRSSGGHDMFVAKYDSGNGMLKWAKAYGSSYADAVVSLAVKGPNLFFTGYFACEVFFDGLAPVDPHGNDPSDECRAQQGKAKAVVVSMSTDKGRAQWLRIPRVHDSLGSSFGMSVAVSDCSKHVYVTGAEGVANQHNPKSRHKAFAAVYGPSGKAGWHVNVESKSTSDADVPSMGMGIDVGTSSSSGKCGDGTDSDIVTLALNVPQTAVDGKTFKADRILFPRAHMDCPTMREVPTAGDTSFIARFSGKDGYFMSVSPSFMGLSSQTIPTIKHINGVARAGQSSDSTQAFGSFLLSGSDTVHFCSQSLPKIDRSAASCSLLTDAAPKSVCTPLNMTWQATHSYVTPTSFVKAAAEVARQPSQPADVATAAKDFEEKFAPFQPKRMEMSEFLKGKMWQYNVDRVPIIASRASQTTMKTASKSN